ncbi:hypothetical protein BDQ12DRAFT_765134 [Crucibulum laeve]|uniref:Uncharacterized protein n=1 Tax=Crucibulum laeve TaxID=68775 RepID=A0A5C3MAK1_9AGAR|nr:hypothetical protein BDQ12DRAFT_765134 [Crucibulum laeve]
MSGVQNIHSKHTIEDAIAQEKASLNPGKPHTTPVFTYEEVLNLDEITRARQERTDERTTEMLKDMVVQTEKMLSGIEFMAEVARGGRGAVGVGGGSGEGKGNTTKGPVKMRVVGDRGESACARASSSGRERGVAQEETRIRREMGGQIGGRGIEESSLVEVGVQRIMEEGRVGSGIVGRVRGESLGKLKVEMDMEMDAEDGEGERIANGAV